MLGSCGADCDCPPCMPFCSVWEWCQRTARYGRNSKTPMECQDLWNNPNGNCGKLKIRSRSVPLGDDVPYQSCNMYFWERYEISNKTVDLNLHFLCREAPKYSLYGIKRQCKSCTVFQWKNVTKTEKCVCLATGICINSSSAQNLSLLAF